MPSLIPLILLAPILLFAAYCDLRWMRIPNYISLIGIAIFLLTVPILEPSEAMWRLAASTGVFVIGFILFAMGYFGGGDVKLISVLALVVPTPIWGAMPMIFSGAMLVGMVTIGLWQRAPRLHAIGWVSVTARGRFPMGVSIAGTGIVSLFASLWS